MTQKNFMLRLAALLAFRPRLTSMLIRLAKRGKKNSIGDYMDRWWVIAPWMRLPFALRLHHTKMADGPRLPHNHPFTLYSFVLDGWYNEERQSLKYGQAIANALLKGLNGELPVNMPDREPPTYVRHSPFNVFEIPDDVYHRITAVSPGGVWTLVLYPRRKTIPAWGFLDEDNTHLDRVNYKRPEGF